MSSHGGLQFLLGSLRNHNNPTNLHIWQWKTVFLSALHVHFSSFDILKTLKLFIISTEIFHMETCIWIQSHDQDSVQVICRLIYR